MNPDNVFKMPDLLDRLAARGVKALKDFAQGMNQQTNGLSITQAAVIEYGTVLREARAEIASDTKFGKWVKERGLDTMAPFNTQQDRNAAVKIADLVPKVITLGNCPNSRPTNIMTWIRKTYPHLFPKRAAKGSKTKKAKESKLTGNRDAVAKQLGVSHATVDVARAAQKARDDLLAELKVDPATLTLSAQAKVEVAKRQAQREVDKQHAARMKGLDEEVRQRVLKDGEPHRARLEAARAETEKSKERYERMINNYTAIFTSDEYRLILSCLHPDSRLAVSNEKLGEAFRLFNVKKFQLIHDFATRTQRQG